jgi:hypothetical protein
MTLLLNYLQRTPLSRHAVRLASLYIRATYGRPAKGAVEKQILAVDFFVVKQRDNYILLFRKH